MKWQAVLFWGIPLAYILVRGFRSPDQNLLERWGQAYGIEVTEANRPIVITYLRLTRRIRTIGALAGVVLSVLWVTFTENSNSFLGNGLFLAVVGYLGATVVAGADRCAVIRSRAGRLSGQPARHWPLWMRAHGWGGSYIALVTALLVVSARGVSGVLEAVAWILPAAIGVPLIVRAHTGPHRRPGHHARIAMPDRPSRSP